MGVKKKRILEEGGEVESLFAAHGGQAAPQGANYRWQNDKANDHAAKPVGWRYTTAGAVKLNVSPNKVPTQADIDKYKNREFRQGGEMHRFLYQEARKDKSDINQRRKLEDGGEVEEVFLAKGGKLYDTDEKRYKKISKPGSILTYNKRSDGKLQIGVKKLHHDTSTGTYQIEGPFYWSPIYETKKELIDAFDWDQMEGWHAEDGGNV